MAAAARELSDGRLTLKSVTAAARRGRGGAPCASFAMAARRSKCDRGSPAAAAAQLAVGCLYAVREPSDGRAPLKV